MTTPDDGYDKLFDELLRESARAAADFDSDEADYEENEQQELSDRNALRRVKSFSTELQDISDAEYRQ
jgi:GTP-binding protein HflX